MKEKMMRFMQGRYGADQLSQFMLGVGIACIVLNLFTHKTFFYWIFLVVVLITYYRMFSKNVQKRYQENQAYLNKTYKIRAWFASQKSLMQQKKTHHIYKCPTCRQKIRVPKGKGKIEIRCPKCSTTFIKRS